MFCRVFLCFTFYFFSIFAETIQTFYGPVNVEEPILVELIHCPALQRLKSIHQYGVSYYTQTHPEEYNRYDHSLGVFAVLRKNGASMEEQISGLLHDVSHTVFSHVGDWLFGKEYQEEDYQNTIHQLYLSYAGIEEILIKHGYTLNQVPPKGSKFQMLEQQLPNLCADRIDYNLQGAYYQGFLTKEEAIELYEDVHFVEGKWLITKLDLAKKLAQFSLFMTLDCWGSSENHLTSRWLADAMHKALDIGLLSWKDIHFGIDQDVWNKIFSSTEPFIQESMHKLMHAKDYYQLVAPSEAHFIVKFRNRGVDPWVLHEGGIVRLSSIDLEFAKQLENLKTKAAEGWPMQFFNTPVLERQSTQLKAAVMQPLNLSPMLANAVERMDGNASF